MMIETGGSRPFPLCFSKKKNYLINHATSSSLDCRVDALKITKKKIRE